MKSELFKVKKQKLTYSDYITFLTKVAALSLDEDGLIMHSIKNMIFKVMFARYYLDIELPQSDIEAYDIICDINYYDYKDEIAWNQFLDLKHSFEKYCDEIDRNAKKDITQAVIDLVMSLTEFVDNISEEYQNLNVADTLELMTEFKNTLGTVDTDKAIQFFLNQSKDEFSNEDESTLEEEDLN